MLWHPLGQAPGDRLDDVIRLAGLKQPRQDGVPQCLARRLAPTFDVPQAPNFDAFGTRTCAPLWPCPRLQAVRT